jgi:hypothetical protein
MTCVYPSLSHGVVIELTIDIIGRHPRVNFL